MNGRERSINALFKEKRLSQRLSNRFSRFPLFLVAIYGFGHIPLVKAVRKEGLGDMGRVVYSINNNLNIA